MSKVVKRILRSARETLTFMREKDNDRAAYVPDGESKSVHRTWDELREIWGRQTPEE